MTTTKSSSAWTPEKEQELIAAIVKVVPEIVEHEWVGDHKNGYAFCLHCNIDHDDLMRDLDCSGRPITLEDVLRSLMDIKQSLPRIAVVSGGGLLSIIDNGRWVPKDCRWNLGKPLHLQSAELKLFLHSLLCS